MRMITAAVIAGMMALPGVASAQGYSTAPYGYPPGAIVVTPPVATVPMTQAPVYLAPGAVEVAPGATYNDAPIYIDGERYYRDCWWDWGQRRCEIKRWW